MSVGVIIRRGVTSAGSLLLSLVLATVLIAPGVAYAEPSEPDPETSELTTLSWRGLGLPETITLLGANNNQDFTVPVPSGFRVARLRGLIHAPVDFGAGFVEIDDGRGVLLGTVDLPAVTPGQAVVPFEVDVSAAEVRDSAFALSFTVRESALPPEQRCGLGQRVVLSDLSTAFDGIEPAPSTIASFFPPVLQRVTIHAPVDADGAEQQAVLTVASAVARMYRSQSTAVSVVRLPRGTTPPPAPQFTRAIAVERGDAGIDVANPGEPGAYLKIAGRGDQLADQASLVVNQLQSLVQGPNARVEQAGAAGAPDSDELTFEELKLSGKTQVLRTANLTAGVDRSALSAERIDGVKVHLLAAHTPVADLDSATLMVSVNGQSVYTTPLDDKGRVDATFDVPGELLKQRVAFDFALTFSPRQLCSPTIAPLTFQLDPASTVTVQRGGDAPSGFGAVPSELSPEFLVALDGSSPNQLDFAARVVANVARLTGTPLMPRVVDVKAAADANDGALIVANAATIGQTSLRPPIGGEPTAVQVGLRDELRAEITAGLGSVQVFADQPRNRTVVLVTTNGAWTLVEPVLDYIDRLPAGWAGLEGDVAAAGPQGTVTTLTIGPGEVEPTAPTPSSWPKWLAVGVGAVVLVALGAGALLLRRRRSSAAG